MQSAILSTKKNIYAWSITLLGALFFFFALFQCTMMTSLQQNLLLSFNADATKIGILSACYFYANVIFFIPAGIILDKFSIKKIYLINMAISIIGLLLLSIATNLYIAALGRFMSGIMMAFALMACLKLASLWIEKEKMPIASSLIITVGTLGGMASHTPMSILIHSFSWRIAVQIVAFIGLLLLILFAFVINEPPSQVKLKKENKLPIKIMLKKAISIKANWKLGFFTCLLNLPMSILGALFGITFLISTYSINSITASSIVSMLFLGMIAGSPFFGWLSYKIKESKKAMIMGSTTCLFLVLCLLMFNIPSIIILHILFFLIGFTCSAQVLSYPIIATNNPPEIASTAMSFACIIIMGIGYGIGLPLVGYLLDLFSSNTLLYSMVAYKKAFSLIPIGIFISLIIAIFYKEKSIKNNSL